jgi:hypothetical protein
MKAMFPVLLFAFSVYAFPVFAQDQAANARASAGCGPSQVEFDVKTKD